MLISVLSRSNPDPWHHTYCSSIGEPKSSILRRFQHSSSLHISITLTVCYKSFLPLILGELFEGVKTRERFRGGGIAEDFSTLSSRLWLEKKIPWKWHVIKVWPKQTKTFPTTSTSHQARQTSKTADLAWRCKNDSLQSLSSRTWVRFNHGNSPPTYNRLELRFLAKRSRYTNPHLEYWISNKSMDCLWNYWC